MNWAEGEQGKRQEGSVCRVMERYSHAKNAAKRQAVQALNVGRIQRGSPQFPPQQNLGANIGDI
jgi:hypothetical protein